MIVSASYRTDIPAFYAPWLMRRLAAGFCRVANPYGGPPSEVSLRSGDVDGFVLWTRNIAPLMASLAEIRRRAPFVVQFTANGYPRALEASVIEPTRAVAQIAALRRDWGARVAVWRYDPILLTSLTPSAWHEANFATLAARLAGSTDEVVVSFANVYRKTARNLDAAARRHGFTWHDPPADEKRALLRRLAAIAGEHGMRLTLCTQPELACPGLAEASCIDAARLSEVAQAPIAAPERGNRPGCRCALSRDIGAYDSCPHGCTYCYAVTGRDRTVRRHRGHDPEGEFLIAPENAP